MSSKTKKHSSSTIALLLTSAPNFTEKGQCTVYPCRFNIFSLLKNVIIYDNVLME